MTKSCLKINVPVDSRLQTVYSILEREAYLKTYVHSLDGVRMYFMVVSYSNKNFETIKSTILENYSKDDYCYFSIETLDNDKYETIRKLLLNMS